jgi:hypothetical protein
VREAPLTGLPPSSGGGDSPQATSPARAPFPPSLGARGRSSHFVLLGVVLRCMATPRLPAFQRSQQTVGLAFLAGVLEIV